MKPLSPADSDLSSFSSTEPSRLSGLLIPALVLCVLLLSVFFLWKDARRSESAAMEKIFDVKAQQTVTVIEQRLSAYTTALHSVHGLFDASGIPDRKTFGAYVSTLHLAERYPGIEGIGFSLIIGSEAKALHVMLVRKEGFAAYSVIPDGDRKAYAPIYYMEPFSGDNLRALGFDMYSDPMRRAVMERARDLGDLSISAKTQLASEQPGCVMYLPVYKKGMPISTLNDRRANIVGWIHAPLRVADLVSGLSSGRQGARAIDVELFDAQNGRTPESILYTSVAENSERASSPEPQFQTLRSIEAGGRNWTIVVASTPEFSSQYETARPTIIAIVGTAFSFFLTLLAWVLVTGRTRVSTKMQEEHERRTAQLLKQAQENLGLLKSCEARYQAIVDNTMFAVLVTKPDGTILSANAAACRMFQRTEEELCQAEQSGIVNPSDPRLITALHERPESANTTLKPMSLARADGSIFQGELSSTVFTDCNGERRVSLLIRDVTNESGSTERMEALSAELKAANEKIVEVSRLKSGLVANLSREIRTPLNVILGMTDLFAGTVMTVQQAGYLKTIQELGRSLLTLINDVLDFSKIEAGKLSLDTMDFNIINVVEETISTLQPAADAKRLEIVIENMLAGSSTYLGDPVRLKQILMNLIGNAVKFTDTGRVTLSIEKTQEHAESSVILFTIADTGIGLTSAEKEKLFMAFPQGADSSTQKIAGSGLGLTITKQLVELMGGSIGVESEAGKGSTFWFTATFQKRKRGVMVSTPPVPRPPVPEPVPRDPMMRYDAHILLVEDFPTNQKVALAILEKLGFTNVDVVSSGHDAVTSASTWRYDLVLMDVQMQEIDGIEASRKIRATGNTIPIVAMAAYTILGDREKCLEAGMDDYITKPITRQELLRVLERFLSSASHPVSSNGNGKAPSNGNGNGKASSNGNGNSKSNGAASLEKAGQAKPVVFDRGELLSALLGDEENMWIILREFLEDLPGQLTQLEDYLKVRDKSNAAHLARGIKGGAASVSCHALSTHAGELESACMYNDFLAAHNSLKQLAKQYELLQAVVKEIGIGKI
ncbi:MAG TPA: CHASE domain-containing protein [Bacteroidota bacterium]|nr:CHASE domain-containing protein [Bacteroidota bacterium]